MGPAGFGTEATLGLSYNEL